MDGIAQLLGPSPISFAGLARIANLEVARIRIAAIELEIDGPIERSGGYRFALPQEAS